MNPGGYGLLGIAAAMLSGCVYAPGMSAHTPFTLNETSARFGDRIASRFPVGSSEGELVAELRRQGFKISAVTWPPRDNPAGYASQALYRGSYYVACEIDWNVFWRAEDGRITAIRGTYGDVCL